MTDEQCGDLPVWAGVDEAGTKVILSCWRLSKEDLEEVQRTGRIWLRVVGSVMPVVSLATENPFE